ncbi:hypothetical protein NHG40_29940 [Bacillus thuringiensis]|nr:hypothetical protein [Bacillus thuringiensis]MCR6838021.1 hypothetical protein [Bacillus thuringiensis]
MSRNVILEAYDQLFSEGFLVTQQGSPGHSLQKGHI